MSLWWVSKEQLDEYQLGLIENLTLREQHLVLGPPGSGKTNVLLRRAQFVRSQRMPNVLVLTFTRPLTEFVKTGCFDGQGREIFPQSCVTTFETWIRGLYRQHKAPLPAKQPSLGEWKSAVATGACEFASQGLMPQYDTLFIDEAQDLVTEEVKLLAKWSPVLFFVGDDRQRIYGHVGGLDAVRDIVSASNVHKLPFHYRIAPEICRMADRILVAQGGASLEATCQYNGPRPGRITIVGPMSTDDQLRQLATKLKDQVRAYADLIEQGDRLGVIVARRDSRQVVKDFLDADSQLAGKSQIIRARDEDERDFSAAFEANKPISILTVAGCKGLEFRAVHWAFCDDLSGYHTAEHYYTVVSRAKTSLDISCTHEVPQILAKAYAEPTTELW